MRDEKGLITGIPKYVGRRGEDVEAWRRAIRTISARRAIWVLSPSLSKGKMKGAETRSVSAPFIARFGSFRAPFRLLSSRRFGSFRAAFRLLSRRDLLRHFATSEKGCRQWCSHVAPRSALTAPSSSLSGCRIRRARSLLPPLWCRRRARRLPALGNNRDRYTYRS